MIPSLVCFTPRGWYIRWPEWIDSDGLPPSLQNKLNTRQAHLPGVKFLAVSESEVWFVQFDDGSSTWSGIFDQICWQTIQDKDEDVVSVVFAPGGGYFVQFESGSGVYHSLPFGLANILSGEGRTRKSKHSKTPSVQLSELRRATISAPTYDVSGLGVIVSAPPRKVSFVHHTAPDIDLNLPPEEHLHVYKGRIIQILAISGSGAWFVQFDDGAVAWDGLPSTLDKLLTSKLKKPNIYANSTSTSSDAVLKQKRSVFQSRNEFREEEGDVVLTRKTRSSSILRGVKVTIFAFSPTTSGSIYVAFDDGTHFWLSQDKEFQKLMKSSSQTSIAVSEPSLPSSPISPSREKYADIAYHSPRSEFLSIPEDSAVSIPTLKFIPEDDLAGSYSESHDQLAPLETHKMLGGKSSEYYRNHYLQRERLSFSALQAPPEVAAKMMNGLAIISKKPIKVDPRKLLFTLDYITSTFENGQSIFLLFADLTRGEVTPESVPPIRFFYDPRDDFDEEEEIITDEEDIDATRTEEESHEHELDEIRSVVSHADSDESRVTYGTQVTGSSSTLPGDKRQERRMWCLDNKRLWVFRKIETITSVSAIVVEAPPDFLQWCDHVDGTRVNVMM